MRISCRIIVGLVVSLAIFGLVTRVLSTMEMAALCNVQADPPSRAAKLTAKIESDLNRFQAKKTGVRVGVNPSQALWNLGSNVHVRRLSPPLALIPTQWDPDVFQLVPTHWDAELVLVTGDAATVPKTRVSNLGPGYSSGAMSSNPVGRRGAVPEVQPGGKP